MQYMRVIPRDLFNEAKLLKCVGAVALHVHEYQPDNVRIEYNGAPFAIEQNEADGSTFVANLMLIVNDCVVLLASPLNSREAWPLLFCNPFTDDEQPAFNDDGTLTYSFIESVKFNYPYYGLRLLGGLIFFSGMLVMVYNVWRTIADVKPAPVPVIEPVPGV